MLIIAVVVLQTMFAQDKPVEKKNVEKVVKTDKTKCCDKCSGKKCDGKCCAKCAKSKKAAAAKCDTGKKEKCDMDSTAKCQKKDIKKQIEKKNEMIK